LTNSESGGNDEQLRPEGREKPAPCQVGCLAGTDVRGWIATIAQRRKLGLTEEEAYTRAWQTIVAANPIPAAVGRICPHPCEADCNRDSKDGAVSVSRLESFIGDWALARGLPLERLESERRSESIGVIGSGPAGLSFAYQMARRGYDVVIYERRSRPGGMLRYGVPPFRLPRAVLDAEIGRIVDLGVEIRTGTHIGRDITLEEIESRHEIVFLGIGAHRGRPLGIPGEAGAGLWVATDFLRRANLGERIDLGDTVIVIGGGNTAVDAARVARRGGSDVTIIYRRSRDEMPAGGAEIDEALEEGIRLEVLAAPKRIERNAEGIVGVVVQRMRLGVLDASGRRVPCPIDGTSFSVPATAVIAAVSQMPDWEGLDALSHEGAWARTREDGSLGNFLWAAGDVVSPGVAGSAIGKARLAAEIVDARLRGRPAPRPASPSSIEPERVRPDSYPDRPRCNPSTLSPGLRLERPDDEVHVGLTQSQFETELARCLSCGQCFGCELCWTYCAHECFTRLEEVRPGSYFSVVLDHCQSCGKCVDLCPCGFLETSRGNDA
jgi:NADPH-dependent glutamate synthase beta subunit-like oxidoreductase